MQTLVLLLIALWTHANALCIRGNDGTSASIVVTPGTNCFEADFYFGDTLTASEVVCNGSTGPQGETGAIGPAPTVTLTGSGCATVAGTGIAKICNGTNGATGAQGAVGPQGPPPTIAQGTNGCLTITGSGSGIICNGSAAVTNTTVLQGPPPTITPAGTTGCVVISGQGSTTLCNGTNGINNNNNVPIRFVDGIQYPLTRLGLQAAINDTNAGGTGKIIVTANIQSDGVKIILKSDVDLDFNWNRLILLPGEVDMIAIGTSGVIPEDILVAQDALNGADNITVSGLDTANVPYQVGDLLLLRYNSLKVHGVQFLTVLIGIDLATGTLQLADSLTYDIIVADGGCRVTHILDTARRAQLRNMVCDVNNNNGTNSLCLETRTGCVECLMENHIFMGAMGSRNTANYQAAAYYRQYASTINNVVAMGFSSSTTPAGTVFRDISFDGCQQTKINGVTSIDATGFGPRLGHCHRCTMSNVHITNSNARGLRIDTSSWNVISNVVISDSKGGAGDGVRFFGGSHHNTMNGLSVPICSRGALAFDGDCSSGTGAGDTCDSHNRVTGFRTLGRPNVAGNPLQAVINNGVYAHNNTVEGSWIGVVNNFNLAVDGVMIENHSQGFTETSVSRVHPTTASFSSHGAMRACIWSMAVDNVLRVTCKGLLPDTNIRFVEFTLS